MKYPHASTSDPGGPSPDAARLLLQQTLTAYEDKAAKAMRILEDGFDDVTAVLSLPEKYRKRLRKTNSVERLNEEVRRRERVIRIFPYYVVHSN